MIPIIITDGKRRYLFRGKDIHTDRGVIRAEDVLNSEDGKVRTHLGYEFSVRKARSEDYFHHFIRTRTPLMPKDIGAIIAYTGLKPSDIVLDAGTGTGILAAFLATIASKVVTCETNPQAARVAMKNFRTFGIENVEVILGDIRMLRFKRKFDVITLDLPEAHETIPIVSEYLREGGYLVVYSPYMDKATEAMRALKEFTHVRGIEIMEREINVTKRGIRPNTRVAHTGYIVIARK
jgi:tRNA (adenine57-N1/adenine58-N1)-methyltransferase